MNEELNLKSNRFIDWAGWVSTNKANIFFKIPEIHPYFENFVSQTFLEKGTLIQLVCHEMNLLSNSKTHEFFTGNSSKLIFITIQFHRALLFEWLKEQAILGLYLKLHSV
ncbi:hypothetical protein AO498_08520 [Algoriphagus sanaruensis]|uniref:Uncharacterized protein n=1 Tax=Algoriphagus sanaruensis TaxID=1727163 RepID=A0A142EMV3_9BACT|nr:hypothetical protein AO498_08520 [Algoriphagus sanaruensis]